MRKGDQQPSKAEVVLLWGFSETLAAAAEGLPVAATVLSAGTPEEVLELLASKPVSVLCLGDALAGKEAADCLQRVAQQTAESGCCNIVLSAGSELELFQELVDEDQVYYLSQQPPPVDDIRSIIRSALANASTASQRTTLSVDRAVDAITLQSVLEISQHLAREATAERAAVLTAQAAERLAGADRAWCLIYDVRSETLWMPRAEGGEERRESAAAGLVSFVVRTGDAIRLDHVGADSRYDAEADTDGGAADQRFLAVPVASNEGVLAVVVAVRDASHRAFSAADQQRLHLLAEQLVPILARFSLQDQLEQLAAERAPAATIYRREALEHHARGFQDQGRLLQLSPGWIGWTTWVLLGGFLAALLFSLLATSHEYAAGLSVVRVEGRAEINARVSGTVTEVAIEPGQRVVAGQLLVGFYDAQEAAELERITHEFELGLISRLRTPADQSSERTLSALRSQKQLAEARLEEQMVRAPHAGTVGDLWVRPGQHLMPGQRIVALIGDDPQLMVISLFPGHYRPLIEPGMPLRLELQGYRYAYQHLQVDTIGEEVVGPAEARRMLGEGIGDAVPLAGPVVFVHSRLPAQSFTSGGQVYDYHAGMQGIAEVQVRSERVLTTLIPGIKALLADGGD